MERERDVERWLRRQIENRGGMFLKFTSPGNAGVPDRIIILPGGKIHFAELKTERGRLSAVQKWQVRRLRDHDAVVVLISGRAAAENYLAAVDLYLQKGGGDE
ncbi:MAG: VRR-NUC domain-containing protein [bacterium]|nr:VRR-NUC domain-containing protein [bacterium]